MLGVGKKFDVLAMRKKEDLFAKTVIIMMTIFFLAIFGLFVFWFFSSIKAYDDYALEYDDLLCADLTFDHYERRSVGKSGHEYKIYFKEYAEPFQVNQITAKKLNEKEMKNISECEVLRVYYQASSSRKYAYEICEMHSNDVVLLTLNDYVTVNQNNQVIAMIVAPICAIGVLYLVAMGLYGLLLQYGGRPQNKRM